MIKCDPVDQSIYENEIKPYLPAKIFDAHTHLCTHRFAPDLDESIPLAKDPIFGEVDMKSLRQSWQMLFPDIKVNGLVLGFPTKKVDIASTNAYLASQCDAKADRMSLLCSPDTNNDTLENWIKEYKPAGLKPYMCFSRKKNYNESAICDLIPESQIAIADKYNLAITLHVAKPKGMADEENLSEITRLVKTYPNCNFILAHCGRCFIAPNMELTLKKLPTADNLWFDTSAVCDTGVFLYLFSRYDAKKILFGTDLVTASGFRGSYIRMGMSWDFITADKLQRPIGQQIKATFAAYENLCALICAARFCKLTKLQIEDIFYNNSQELFNLKSR
jgi:glutamate-1-semialdehyde 2,1-aminomutase